MKIASLIVGIALMILSGSGIVICLVLIATTNGRISLEESLLVVIPLAFLFFIAFVLTIVSAIFVMKAKKKPPRGCPVNKLKKEKNFMKNVLFGLKLGLVLACLASGLACGTVNSSSSGNSSSVNVENINSNPITQTSVSPTPEATSNLPKYTAHELAAFLRAEYQKTAGKGDANAGLKDKEIEITGNVSLVKNGDVDFFVDPATRVRCRGGSSITNKELNLLESYYEDNVRGTTRFMPKARAKGTFSYWGAATNSGKSETEIVLTGCEVLGTSRM